MEWLRDNEDLRYNGEIEIQLRDLVTIMERLKDNGEIERQWRIEGQ